MLSGYPLKDYAFPTVRSAQRRLDFAVTPLRETVSSVTYLKSGRICCTDNPARMPQCIFNFHITRLLFQNFPQTFAFLKARIEWTQAAIKMRFPNGKSSKWSVILTDTYLFSPVLFIAHFSSCTYLSMLFLMLLQCQASRHVECIIMGRVSNYTSLNNIETSVQFLYPLHNIMQGILLFPRMAKFVKFC